ncbi:hypothetical protein A2U01_0112239, partial [Trifolium medium]|nr:hypothetical protein [Trifolium medium]
KVKIEGESAKKKKGSKKRKSEDVKIVESITKQRHDKKPKSDDSDTESDDGSLAKKLKQRSSEDKAKEFL